MGGWMVAVRKVRYTRLIRTSRDRVLKEGDIP